MKKPHIPGRVDVPLNVDLTTSGSLRPNDIITDLNFGVGIIEDRMDHTEAILTAPDGSWVMLFRHRVDGFGNTRNGGTPFQGNYPPGLPNDFNLGVLRASNFNAGTTFDDEAPRPVNDPNNPSTGSYTYYVRTEAVVGTSYLRLTITSTISATFTRSGRASSTTSPT